MICVSVQETNFTKCKEILAKSEMAEIRADLCGFTIEQMNELMLHPNILFTCRIENSSREYAYQHITNAIMKGAKYVDVEIEAPVDHIEYIKSYANSCGCKLIISYHNFNETPSLNELEQIYDLCLRKGADIVKIVTTSNATEDAIRTLELYKTEKYLNSAKDSLVAFSMGKAGKFTRKLCLDLGSPYTYVSYDEASATAPGQYTLQEMKELLSIENYPFHFDSNYRLPNEITIPCSKSVAQRAILAAALSEGETTLRNFAPCNDINGAIEVIKRMGCKVECLSDTLKVVGLPIDRFNEISKIEIGESGLLTRLLIPFSLFLSGYKNGVIEINGHGSILNRDLTESIDAIKNAGGEAEATNKSYLPLKIKGGIKNREIIFSGKASSQIVSGFLMTLPLIDQDTTLTILEPTSIPYIELTLDVLEKFGIEVERKEANDQRLSFYIRGGQKYKSTKIYLDADWSSASFFAVAGAISGNIKLKNMPINSSQADEYVLNVLRDCNVAVKIQDMADGLSDIEIIRENKLESFSANLVHCPDLFPILALLAIFCDGETKLYGVQRLAEKESNRAESIYSEFTSLGADINISDGIMHISGGELFGGKVSAHNDHRIAMSLIMASLFIKERIKIDNIKCIDKSFPSFLDRLIKK